MEGGGSIHLDALTQITGQSLLAAFSAFCVNDRFDYLSSRTVLEGSEIRRYRPFDDAPVEGKFDWAGFARNLLYGVMVTTLLVMAAVATGGAAAFVGAAIAAGMTTVMISATDYSTGNVRSYEEAQRDIVFAAIIGAVTGATGGVLKGVEIFANPFANMAIKEAIESYAATKAGILLRTLESIGMPPKERFAYIYDWKTLVLDFGLGTLIGIGVGSAGIAFKSVAGEAVEQTVEDATVRAVKDGTEEALELEAKEVFKVSSLADYMSPEEARKYLKLLENGSTAGLRPEELLGIQKVDDYLALSRVDYDEVLRLRNSTIWDSADGIVIGRADLDAIRNRLGVLDTNTIAVGKTNVKGLEDIIFEGQSPGVRNEAGLPDLDIIWPNRNIKAPNVNPLFTRHAEEVVANEFDRAVIEAGLDPQDVVGVLKIHQSNPSGVCKKCIQGLANDTVSPGVLKQLSLKYPKLRIEITSEISPDIEVSGKSSFIIQNGKYVE